MEIQGNVVLIRDPVIVEIIKESVNDKEYINSLICAIREIVSLKRQPVNVDDMFEHRLDEICERIQNGVKYEVNIDEICKKLDQGMNTMSDLKHKMEGFTRDDGVYLQLSEIKRALSAITTKSSATRGKEAEQSVIDLLSDELLSRDGYTIENVSGVAHNCDICVKRTGYNDVRIDVKNYTDKVAQRDVDKFYSDLNTVGCSGIMLCMKNGVVGKKNMEIEQLTSGKFAIFLTHNKYDMSVVGEMIRLIYFLENATQIEDDNTRRLSSETLSRLYAIALDGKIRVNSIKTHMKSAMTELDSLKFMEIENLLRTKNEHATVVNEQQSLEIFVCSKCKRHTKSRAALVQHEKTCKNLNVP